MNCSKFSKELMYYPTTAKGEYMLDKVHCLTKQLIDILARKTRWSELMVNFNCNTNNFIKYVICYSIFLPQRSNYQYR